MVGALGLWTIIPMIDDMKDASHWFCHGYFLKRKKEVEILLYDEIRIIIKCDTNINIQFDKRKIKIIIASTT